jgi:hypothetical protein
MVNHVPILAGLMIAQGALECLLGALFAGMGPFMYYMAKSQSSGTGPAESAVISIYMSGVGLLALTAGILNITAGVKGIKYRGRVLGIVALVSGVVTLPTCYCFPTSLMLLVYGLIVYLNPEVARAFEMGGRLSSADIKATFE